MTPHTRALPAALALLALAGCGWSALDSYGPLTVFDNFYAIEPGQAYRSAQLDAETLSVVLADYEIRTVINLRGENPGEGWYQREKAACDAAGVELVDIAMRATALPSREILLSLYDALLAAEHPMLIHCRGGADRSGAAAAIWRMVVRGDDRAAASAELSPRYGHFPAINPEMDELVAMFEPDRAWIENEYPAP